MQLIKRESSSGNLMTLTGSLQKKAKTNHVSSYTEKNFFFLVPTMQYGKYKWEEL